MSWDLWLRRSSKNSGEESNNLVETMYKTGFSTEKNRGTKTPHPIRSSNSVKSGWNRCIWFNQFDDLDIDVNFDTFDRVQRLISRSLSMDMVPHDSGWKTCYVLIWSQIVPCFFAVNYVKNTMAKKFINWTGFCCVSEWERSALWISCVATLTTSLDFNPTSPPSNANSERIWKLDKIHRTGKLLNSH